jgi:hypothetical protein
MFGMLDYRAHKLYWLIIYCPFWIFHRLAYIAILVSAIAIADTFRYSPIVRMLIAYGIFEGSFLVIGLLSLVLGALLRRCFFWLIDVIPARGSDEEEAKAVVLHGRIIWLGKKLQNDIENWTWDDTEALVSATNWRARWLFNASERLHKRIGILQDYYFQTGRQPGTLKPEETKALVGHVDGGRLRVAFEYATISPQIFYSMVAAAIIVILFLFRAP